MTGAGPGDRQQVHETVAPGLNVPLNDTPVTTLGRRDFFGALALVILGVGTRLAFNAFYPVLPFWDFLGLIHFGALLHDHGLTATGWYWSQFNPGLPVILAALFRVFPGDQTLVARTATAVATGLLPLLPFLLWRRALAFRWRIVAGALLALWPGQIFFSGVVAQDNWVLLPTIALGSLAVARLLGNSTPRPLVAGLLYVAAIAIRQEMALVLLPVLIPAGVGGITTHDRRHSLVTLALTVAVALSALVAQRSLATGRLAVTTEHGALGLYGSFMPGASEEGWIDGRAYASVLHPESSGRKLFGQPATLLQMTREEAARRPAFHLLRIAAWLPRLAVDSDASNLRWSVGAALWQKPDRRIAAGRLAQKWADRLKWELAFLQGLFVATAAIGLARRNPAILALSTAALLKFAVHMVVSPLDRLMVPAIALELLVIPLGAAEFDRGSSRLRAGGATLALGIAAALYFGVPRLTAFVVAHDSPVLPGIRQFDLGIEGNGVARCTLEAGVLTGIGPKWAALRAATENPHPGEVARVSCALPAADPKAPLTVAVHAPFAPFGLGGQRTVRVEIDGSEAGRFEMANDASVTAVRIPPASPSTPLERVAIEIVAGSPDPGGARRGRDASIRLAFERAEPTPTADIGARP